MSGCKKGEIKRSSYRRKSKKIIPATIVKARCIKDQGQPGKGKKLFTIKEKDLLGQYGYTTKNSKQKRETSIKKALSRENPLGVLRHLNAIRTLNKSRENVYNKMNSDVKFIQREYKKISKKKKSKKSKKI